MAAIFHLKRHKLNISAPIVAFWISKVTFYMFWGSVNRFMIFSKQKIMYFVLKIEDGRQNFRKIMKFAIISQPDEIES